MAPHGSHTYSLTVRYRQFPAFCLQQPILITTKAACYKIQRLCHFEINIIQLFWRWWWCWRWYLIIIHAISTSLWWFWVEKLCCCLSAHDTTIDIRNVSLQSNAILRSHTCLNCIRVFEKMPCCLLFFSSIYMNDLVTIIQISLLGCHIHYVSMGILLYADDVRFQFSSITNLKKHIKYLWIGAQLAWHTIQSR